MLNTFLSIIPLDIASTISPIILALTIFLLSNKHHQRSRLLAFLTGSILVGIVITTIGFNLGQHILTNKKDPEVSAIVDLFLGSLFLFFSIKSFITKERKIKVDSNPENKKILKWFIIGLLVNATNFDALFLNLTASKEVGNADISMFAKIVLLFVNLLFFTLPVTFPIFLYSLFPLSANKVLDKVNFYLVRYGRYIVGILFLIFALIFLIRGATFFW